MKRYKIRKNAGGPGEVQKATRLTSLDVEEVSLVDAPAIGKTFYVTKGATTGQAPATTEPVAKDDTPLTFNQIITLQNVEDALWDAFRTLREVVFQSIPQTNGTELIQLAFAQCSAYVLNLISNPATVAKSMDAYQKDKVAKAGAKVSQTNMQALQDHCDQLGQMGETMKGAMDMCGQMHKSMTEFIKSVSPQDPTPEPGGVTKTQDSVPATATSQALPIQTGMPVVKAIDPTALAELQGQLNSLTEVIKNQMISPEKMAEIAGNVAKSLK